MSRASNLRHKLLDVGSQLKHTHLFNPKITPPRQAWVENFIGEEKKLFGIVDLHPREFGVFSRIDYASTAVNYRGINYASTPARNEVPGGPKKTWPQKGTGRSRHGSV